MTTGEAVEHAAHGLVVVAEALGELDHGRVAAVGIDDRGGFADEV